MIARITATPAPHMRKKTFESFHKTRAMIMIIISVITDVAAIIFTFLPSIRTSYFLFNGKR
jgi:hypothetical protein